MTHVLFKFQMQAKHIANRPTLADYVPKPRTVLGGDATDFTALKFAEKRLKVGTSAKLFCSENVVHRDKGIPVVEKVCTEILG
jgi:hypothetical protein